MNDIAIIMLGGKRGGVEQAAVDYCEALAAQGHKVTAIVRRNAAVLPQLNALAIAVKEIAFPHPLNPFAARRIHHLTRDAQCIIVHGNRAGQLTHSISHAPVIAVAHSRFFKFRSHFASVIALSHPQASSLALTCPVHVIPNMIRIPSCEPRTTRHAPLIIGTMGRLSPEKGIDLLLDAATLLHARGVAFRLRIGGAGALEASLKQYAQAAGLAVEWVGWVSNKTEFYRGLDMFVLPSRTENFPITLLEAMAHGLPCVATRCGGPQTILTDAQTGLLANLDAESIATQLQRLVTEPAFATTLGASAQNYAAQHFSFEVVSKQLHTLVIQHIHTTSSA